MGAAAVVIAIVVILLVLLVVALTIYLALFYNPVNNYDYENNVLNLINNQNSWGYYKQTNLITPYNFVIVSYAQKNNGTIKIDYVDNVGNYLVGIVSFNAKYTVDNKNTISITPINLISTATGRWPKDKIWKLTFVNTNQLTLDNGLETFNLIHY